MSLSGEPLPDDADFLVALKKASGKKFVWENRGVLTTESRGVFVIRKKNVVTVLYDPGDEFRSSDPESEFGEDPESVGDFVKRYLAWTNYVNRITIPLSKAGYESDGHSDWTKEGRFYQISEGPVFTILVDLKRIPEGAEVALCAAKGVDLGNMFMAKKGDVDKRGPFVNLPVREMIGNLKVMYRWATLGMSVKEAEMYKTLVTLNEAAYTVEVLSNKTSPVAEKKALNARSTFYAIASDLIPKMIESLDVWAKGHTWTSLHGNMINAVKKSISDLKRASNNLSDVGSAMSAISLAVSTVHVHGLVLENLGFTKWMLDDLHEHDVSHIDAMAERLHNPDDEFGEA